MDPMEAFRNLVREAGPRAKSAPPAKFVKRMDEIPSVELSPADPCRLALLLSENALIGKFIGLWPSPKAVEQWIAERWSSLAPSHISMFAAGRGYFVFSFANKEERDLIFRSGPFFMGSRGLFLAPWTLDFNPEAEITAAPVWVRLPHLPLHLWGKNSLADIGNKLGRFLDSAEPKGDQYTCARICVEVNLEKGLSEALQLTLGAWSHVQALDYEHIPFKCLRCHVYGHFAKSCPKAKESEPAPPAIDAGFQPVSNRRRGPRRKDPIPEEAAAKETPLAFRNSFEALNAIDDKEEEAEVAAEVVSKDPQEIDGQDLGATTTVVETLESEPGRDHAVPAAEEDPVARPAPSAELPNFEKAAKAPVMEGNTHKVDSPDDRETDLSSENRSPNPERFILASMYSSSGRSSETPGFSPPLTRGRKTNKERRDREAARNIGRGSQSQLDDFVKIFK